MTSSPPATPPAEPPHDPELWRFDDTGATCEWAEEYCPGGFHPVNLGDTFHGGKYRVIRKLGDGSYSTVWLAVSTGQDHQHLFAFEQCHFLAKHELDLTFDTTELRDTSR
jgi:hypothetical protein